MSSSNTLKALVVSVFATFTFANDAEAQTAAQEQARQDAIIQRNAAQIAKDGAWSLMNTAFTREFDAHLASEACTVQPHCDEGDVDRDAGDEDYDDGVTAVNIAKGRLPTADAYLADADQLWGLGAYAAAVIEYDKAYDECTAIIDISGAAYNLFADSIVHYEDAIEHYQAGTTGPGGGGA